MRAAGAVPATIGVLDGEIRVGLGPEELERFTPGARKLGPRDLAACAAQGGVGATTVGGTLAVARAAAIRFLGTGGIGGVHRGYPRRQTSPPTSSRSCRRRSSSRARARSRCSTSPPRWSTSRRSGSRSWDSEQARSRSSMRPRAGPLADRVESAAEAASVAAAHWELGGCGLLLANPPAESIDVSSLIEEESPRPQGGVTGQAMTPFVLSFLHERSDGRTRDVNRKLIVANAGLAAGRGSVRRAVSLYANVRDLPVEIEGYELEGLELQARPDFLRRTTVVHLRGAARKASARTSRTTVPSTSAAGARPDLPLAGSWTLHSFSEHLAGQPSSSRSRPAGTGTTAAGRTRAPLSISPSARRVARSARRSAGRATDLIRRFNGTRIAAVHGARPRVARALPGTSLQARREPRVDRRARRRARGDRRGRLDRPQGPLPRHGRRQPRRPEPVSAASPRRCPTPGSRTPR